MDAMVPPSSLLDSGEGTAVQGVTLARADLSASKVGLLAHIRLLRRRGLSRRSTYQPRAKRQWLRNMLSRQIPESQADIHHPPHHTHHVVVLYLESCVLKVLKRRDTIDILCGGGRNPRTRTILQPTTTQMPRGTAPVLEITELAGAGLTTSLPLPSLAFWA